MSAGSPVVSIHYNSSQGYFIESQNGDRSESEIKPGVHCPKDERLMYLAEVRPEKKELPPMENARNVTRSALMGEISSTAVSSG